MTRPRLLLVEDDASIRRFVGLAVEDLELDLVQAASLRGAIDALRSGPFTMVMCDLMLPDGNGFDLLQSLADADSPSPQAHRVAFSAGVSAQARERLQAIGVHEVLAKPASLGALLDCVQRGLARAEAPAAPVRPAVDGCGSDDDTDAVARYFGGNQVLYDAFASQCRLRWPIDAAQGEQAAAAADLPALRRLAHSLKSVLLSLGYTADGTLARDIETLCTEGLGDEAWAAWQRLRDRLLARADGSHTAAKA